ncbi:uncharacterized protein PHALS_14563 [Plasmopara halstedii]|uniref:Uncharacterized protein n=1 Tax=Plasmopara halstedii TaxID=4781 RepID=A0A0P1AL26_PLAHL|nr:uncharacterized protein PHALS_14563 [Plasmopara halstedii]CEG41783.1 hypothetical protein PHALS_14563 [Plasmopara halstedii]|eukprot:XP_024578152.1 hypothetical protein PHALS_14563 [Plasmopara halstedii]
MRWKNEKWVDDELSRPTSRAAFNIAPVSYLLHTTARDDIPSGAEFVVSSTDATSCGIPCLAFTTAAFIDGREIR